MRNRVPLIIMGVQGTGKSTVGSALAREFGMRFIDGDDLHPVANKEKMAAGIPLSDDDREPWLHKIGETIAKDRTAGTIDAVVCSALKKQYRDLLRSYIPDLKFVHLHGAKELIARRISRRNHEYMPASLLDSQFATLEELHEDEAGIIVNIEPKMREVVANIVEGIEKGVRSC